MGFSGGGSNILKAHKHSAAVQDGGTLDMDNVTEAELTQGDIVFSDGNALQRLAIGAATNALVVNGAATAPEWAAGGSLSITQQVVNPTHASTVTSTSFVDLAGSVSITLPVRAGGFAFLQYDWIGENSLVGYVNICWNINGVDLNTGATTVASTGKPTGCSISAITPLNGDVCKLRIRSNTGTITTYSNGAVSGSTQGLSLEIG
jgi:hypothetical protein